MHTRSVSVKVLPHGSIVPEQLAAALEETEETRDARAGVQWRHTPYEDKELFVQNHHHLSSFASLFFCKKIMYKNNLTFYYSFPSLSCNSVPLTSLLGELNNRFRVREVKSRQALRRNLTTTSVHVEILL